VTPGKTAGHGAVAVFVKTPRFSPVKTRLAEGAGLAVAQQFYALACAAVGSVVREAAAQYSLTPYWAVADGGDAGDWPDFARLPQGDGGLGAKLWRVYETLRARHGAVCLIGADAPQLTPAILQASFAAVAAAGGFCAGPARDGGFYLFTGAGPLPRAAWEAVSYSASTTLQALETEASAYGRVQRLERTLTDVDTADDLASVRAELEALATPTPEQAALLAWCRRF
jgi:glycosyltransferase A (GT-A) superfamily protein (DUF2064 family)